MCDSLVSSLQVLYSFIILDNTTATQQKSNKYFSKIWENSVLNILLWRIDSYVHVETHFYMFYIIHNIIKRSQTRLFMLSIAHISPLSLLLTKWFLKIR